MSTGNLTAAGPGRAYLRIAGAALLLLGVAALAGPMIFPAAGLLTFFLGAGILLAGGPIGPIAFAIMPMVVARRAPFRLKAAAAIRAISLFAITVGLFAPQTHILPSWAFSNLGPPVLAGYWVAAASMYFGILFNVLPRSGQGTS